MGQAASSSSSKLANKKETDSLNPIITFPPPPSTPHPSILTEKIQPQSKPRRNHGFKKILKSFLFSPLCYHRRRKSRKHLKSRKKLNSMTTLLDGKTGSGTLARCSKSPHELQLHWFRSKHSILSTALSKLAFFSHLSNETDEKKNGNMLKFYHDSGKKTERLGVLSITDLSTNNDDDKSLRTNNIFRKILVKRSSQLNNLSASNAAADGSTPRKICFPDDEIYQKNLKKFEALLTITASTSPSSTSHDSIISVLPCKVVLNRVDLNSSNLNGGGRGDENENLPEKIDKEKSNTSRPTHIKYIPKRIISSSKNRVKVDSQFMDWVKSKMDKEPITIAAAAVTQAEKEASSSNSSNSSLPSKTHKAHTDSDDSDKDKNKGGVQQTGAEGKLATKPPVASPSNEAKSKAVGNKKESGGGVGKKKSSSTSTGADTTSSSTSYNYNSTSNNYNTSNTRTKGYYKISYGKYGKGSSSLSSGPPPVYLDYGDAGSTTVAGNAWKAKRKGDPVMDRIKNVDVVEEMTYLVPNPNCGGGGGTTTGNGNECDDDDGTEEDDCDYYAVCESCGEMEPVPEELKKELKKRKRKKAKMETTTPVTYSRRQRFNFKNRGDMCDEEDDGPPFTYEGQGSGAGCRCSCCVAGLRRNAECCCKCCQTMGSARKCSSFDEMPVGKNPQIRRILTPREECAKRREYCSTQIMPDDSGMYKFDVKDQTFVRHVPRTPTPIILEVEAPAPLTKKELLAIGRDIQDRNRVVEEEIPQEQEPIFLPPIYGQCNPCQPGQPCCIDTVCFHQQQNGNENYAGSNVNDSNYNYDQQKLKSGYYTGAALTRTHKNPTFSNPDSNNNFTSGETGKTRKSGVSSTGTRKSILKPILINRKSKKSNITLPESSTGSLPS